MPSDAPDDAARRAGAGSTLALTTLGNALAPTAALVTLPILANTLGVEGRGAVAAVTAPLMFGAAIAAFGLPDSAVYFIANRRFPVARLLRRLALLAVLSGLATSGLVVALAPVLAGDDDRLAGYIGTASLAIVPSLVAAVCRGVAIGLQEWSLVRRDQLFSACFSLLSIAGLAAAGRLTVPLAIGMIALAPAVGGLAYVRFVGLGVRKQGLTARRVRTREVMAYAGPSWVGTAAGVVLVRLDQTLMTSLAGAYELGLYAVAVGVSAIPLVISGAVSLIAFTTDGADRNDERLAASSRISSSICLLLALCLCLAAPVVFPLAFGPEYSAAIPSTVVLAVAVVVGIPGSVGASALAARGRPALRSAGVVLALLLNIAILVTLVPSLGHMGAALAMLASTTWATVWSLTWLRRLYGLRPSTFVGLRRRDTTVITGSVRTGLRRVRGRTT